MITFALTDDELHRSHDSAKWLAEHADQLGLDAGMAVRLDSLAGELTVEIEDRDADADDVPPLRVVSAPA